MKKLIKISKRNSAEGQSRFPKEDQNQNNHSYQACIEIRKGVIDEMKDFTFYQTQYDNLDPTWDIDSYLNTEVFQTLIGKNEELFSESPRETTKYEDKPNDTSQKLPSIISVDQSEEAMENEEEKVGRSEEQEINMKEFPQKEVEVEFLNITQSPKKEQTDQNQAKTKKIRKGRKNEKKSNQNTLDSKRAKSQTKNIPKNYGKELIRYVQEQRELVQKVMAQYPCEIDYDTLSNTLQNLKDEVRTKNQLLGLWRNEVYGKVMRIVSQHFFRKAAYHYIFNSRIEDFRSALKYKPRLQQFVADPWREDNLKYR